MRARMPAPNQETEMADSPQNQASAARLSLAGPVSLVESGPNHVDGGGAAAAMTEGEVVRAFRRFYEGLFPKVCPNCGQVFASLREYLLASRRLWPSLNYDIELGNYRTPRPIGGLALATCVCGNTLALSTKSMPLAQTHALLEWIRAETVRRGINATELLDHLRDEVRTLVLAEAAQTPAAGTGASLHPTAP